MMAPSETSDAVGGGRCGVVVGKFNPPHLGHLHLIEVAAARVDRLFVLLCDRSDQTLPALSRRAWLEDASPPNVTVLVTPDDLPEASEPWARRALEVLPIPPDIAFTSEAWGPEWADLMGAEHVLVDLQREAVPISATRIRGDLAGHFHWLVPAARADLARRVVLVGAESTGKSTLAEALGRELRTVWVPEHGRWYWMGRRHVEDQTWTSDEFRRIARAQRRLEDDLARRAVGGVVVADTDALVTAAWHERYLGDVDPELEAMLADVVPDLYLVCCPDIPWVQDGTRESEGQRLEMHEAITARARASGASVASLTGPHEDRLASALRAVRALPAHACLVERLSTTATSASAAPWLGRPWEHRHAALAAVGSLIACGAYTAAARVWAPDSAPGSVEFWGTMTSLWSVWITQRRNVLALPVGIVSVVLMGWFFHTLGLRGQTGLHWGYYLPIQVWAWRHWTRGGPQGSELTVTVLPPRSRLAVLIIVVSLTGLLGWLLDTAWQDARYAYWDASIVAASVTAMLLMSAKKVESWWLWILPVNVSAIGLYARTGAFMFAALYVLFLVMAVVGLVRWRRAASQVIP